jgi:hypothetical protein
MGPDGKRGEPWCWWIDTVRSFLRLTHPKLSYSEAQLSAWLRQTVQPTDSAYEISQAFACWITGEPARPEAPTP